jgi:hypothetical protein
MTLTLTTVFGTMVYFFEGGVFKVSHIQDMVRCIEIEPEECQRKSFHSKQVLDRAAMYLSGKAPWCRRYSSSIRPSIWLLGWTTKSSLSVGRLIIRIMGAI